MSGIVDILFLLGIIIAAASVIALLFANVGIAAYLMMAAFFLVTSAILLIVYAGHEK